MTIIDIVESRDFDARSLRVKMSDNTIDSVRRIVDDVKNKGDEAVFEYCKKFDGIEPASLRVKRAEIEEAYEKVDDGFVQTVLDAIKNIEKFQRALIGKDVSVSICDGVKLRSLIRPIENIGVYVPGGTACYVSTVYMIGIPARIAGCRRRILCTPSGNDGKANPYILIAANLSGFTEIYNIGGAQAIAAMAYGTESILKVDKIFGPGNVFVNKAKMIVRDDVDIDMVAGPSEIMIIADESCDARFVAADMISQAEHDTLCCAVLLTCSNDVAINVKNEIAAQIMQLERKNIAMTALSSYGKIVVCDGVDECISIVNDFAPEHLEIVTADNEAVLSRIVNAGSVFLGRYSAGALGDYSLGTNHVLPTMGFAKSMSGLNVADFVRRMEVSDVTSDGALRIGRTAAYLAEIEGLLGHAKALNLRMEVSK